MKRATRNSALCCMIRGSPRGLILFGGRAASSSCQLFVAAVRLNGVQRQSARCTILGMDVTHESRMMKEWRQAKRRIVEARQQLFEKARLSLAEERKPPGVPPGGSSPAGGTPSAMATDCGPFRNRGRRSRPSEYEGPKLETAGAKKWRQ